MEVLWGYVVLLLSLLTAAAADTEHSLTSDMILSALCVITHGSSRVGTALRQIGTPTERLREVEQFAECHTASRWWHWNSNPEGEGLKNTFCKSSLPRSSGRAVWGCPKHRAGWKRRSVLARQRQGTHGNEQPSLCLEKYKQLWPYTAPQGKQHSQNILTAPPTSLSEKIALHSPRSQWKTVINLPAEKQSLATPFIRKVISKYICNCSECFLLKISAGEGIHPRLVG